MPQATPELRAKFPGHDHQALDILERNFTIDRGGIIWKKDKNYKTTPREWDAIDYLFQEWDYAYHGVKEKTMEDKLKDLYDEWSKKNPDAVEFAVFQAGFTMGAVSMRSRAQKLAQTMKGNDLINAIGSLPDIPKD